MLSTRLEQYQLQSKYVFHNKETKLCIQEPKRQIKNVIKASGVKFMLHDLRRTFITIAESLDVNHYTLKKLVNHKIGNDVTGGYIVSTVERLREPMQKITDYVLEQAGIRHVQGPKPDLAVGGQ
jgi:integrase